MRKQNLFKKAAVFLLAGVMMAGNAVPAYAAAGQWKQNAAGWWWEWTGGSYPTSTWLWIDGNNDGRAECYYFDGNGYMLAGTTTPDGYTVNADGAWVENGVVKSEATNSHLHDVAATNGVDVVSTAGAVADGRSWPQITFDETLYKASSDVNGLDLLPNRTQIAPEFSGEDDWGPACSIQYKGKTITLGTYTEENRVIEYKGPASAFFNNFPEQGIELDAFYDNTGYESPATRRKPMASTGRSDHIFNLPAGSYRMGCGIVYINDTYRDFQILLTAGENGKWYIYPDSPVHVN